MWATYKTGLAAARKESARRFTCGIVLTRKGMSMLYSGCSVAIRLKLPSGCRKSFCMSTIIRAERVMSEPIGGDCIGCILRRAEGLRISIANRWVVAGTSPDVCLGSKAHSAGMSVSGAKWPVTGTSALGAQCGHLQYVGLLYKVLSARAAMTNS